MPIFTVMHRAMEGGLKSPFFAEFILSQPSIHGVLGRIPEIMVKRTFNTKGSGSNNKL
jgi:hypothetical protein